MKSLARLPGVIFLTSSVSLIAACDAQMSRVAEESVGQPAIATDEAAVRDFATRGMALHAVVATGAKEATPPQLAPPNAMIIRNGNVTIQVDSLEIAIERVRQLALSLGGQLGNVSMLTGAHQVRTASLEMKIPAARFDSAMVGMPALGKVEQSNATAQDVGEEFVDVSARVANSKRLEARLVGLLSTRTGKLEDVLAVERELARVREEIERQEGRIRYLSSRVAVSTIVATVHEKAPIIAARPGQNVFARAFINMWRNFVSLLTGTIELAGILMPLGILGWAGFWAWRRWRRSRVVVPA